MIEIVRHLHQYVPTIEYQEELLIPSIGQTVKVPRAKFSPLLFGGDQLTAARIRGAKKAKVSSDLPIERLEGIVPVAEDWHTKMNFMGVSTLRSRALMGLLTSLLEGADWISIYSTLLGSL